MSSCQTTGRYLYVSLLSIFHEKKATTVKRHGPLEYSLGENIQLGMKSTLSLKYAKSDFGEKKAPPQGGAFFSCDTVPALGCREGIGGADLPPVPPGAD